MASTIAAPAVEKSAATDRLTYLDGIRGIAIASVLLFHSAEFFDDGRRLEYFFRKLVSGMWMGVDVFFVLSGFLITGILLKTRSSPRYFRSFYMRRTLRIFPLYFGVLTLLFLVLPALKLVPSTPFSLQLWYWTYLYNWQAAMGGVALGMAHFWSLAVEEQFYAVWPLVVYAVPARKILHASIFLIAIAVIFRLVLVVFGLPTRYAFFMTFGRLDGLGLGALIAVLVREHPQFLKKIQRNASKLAALFAATLALAAIWGRGLEPIKLPAIGLATTAVCGLTGLAIITGLMGNGCRRILETPALRWLGIYSYGIYVIHVMLLRIIQWGLKPLGQVSGSLPAFAVATLAAALMIAGTCLLAFASYHLFESRFLKLKSRFEANAARA